MIRLDRPEDLDLGRAVAECEAWMDARGELR